MSENKTVEDLMHYFELLISDEKQKPLDTFTEREFRLEAELVFNNLLRSNRNNTYNEVINDLETLVKGLSKMVNEAELKGNNHEVELLGMIVTDIMGLVVLKVQDSIMKVISEYTDENGEFI